MTAEPDQLDDVGGRVEPNQQIVVFDMALHATLIVAVELVGLIVSGYRLLVGKHL